MSSPKRRLVLLAAVLVIPAHTGCYRAFQNIDGGPSAPDAAVDAGPPDTGSRCPRTAGYLHCEPLCDERCPRDTERQCVPAAGVCAPNLVEGDPRNYSGSGCYVVGSPGEDGLFVRDYCWNGGVCAADPLRWEREGAIAGLCVTPELCAELPSLGVPARCRYSDGTWFEEGPPPLSECPRRAEDDWQTGFCGGPCGACPWIAGPAVLPYPDYHINCVGLSETRNVGVCSFGVYRACSRHEPLPVRCEGVAPLEANCACLTQRVDGVEQEVGWRVFESSCLLYRERYGAEVECHAPDTWEVL